MHQISIREDGKAEMAFTGKRSDVWHGLGQEMTAQVIWDKD